MSRPERNSSIENTNTINFKIDKSIILQSGKKKLNQRSLTQYESSHSSSSRKNSIKFERKFYLDGFESRFTLLSANFKRNLESQFDQDDSIDSRTPLKKNQKEVNSVTVSFLKNFKFNIEDIFIDTNIQTPNINDFNQKIQNCEMDQLSQEENCLFSQEKEKQSKRVSRIFQQRKPLIQLKIEDVIQKQKLNLIFVEINQNQSVNLSQSEVMQQKNSKSKKEIQLNTLIQKVKIKKID